jgi:glycine C-acetyltransferase
MITNKYSARFHEVSDPVREGMAAGLYPYSPVLAAAQRNTSRLDDGQSVIMLTSNNYLGLSCDPRVIEASKSGLDEFGLSTCGARLHNGTTTLHRQLEQAISDWLGYDETIVFSSGFLANVGPLSVLGGPGAVYITDQFDHQSIMDGCGQSGAELRIFSHNDMAKLEYVLQRTQDREYRLVVVDGVYSMDGDMAPLDEIDRLCNEYDALLMVDEAHGLGVVGENGRGACEHFDVHPDILMGTLSKSFGSAGGFVSTSRPIADFIRHMSHAYVFNASPAPALMGGALAALKIMQSEPQLRQRLWRNTIRFRQGLIETGFHIDSGVTPIVPIPVGDDQLAMKMTQELKGEGVFLSVAAFPAVPQGKSRFRTTITAVLENEDIDRAVETITRVATRHNIIEAQL